MKVNKVLRVALVALALGVVLPSNPVAAAPVLITESTDAGDSQCVALAGIGD
jgi:hypothetical protein